MKKIEIAFLSTGAISIIGNIFQFVLVGKSLWEVAFMFTIIFQVAAILLLAKAFSSF